MVYKKYKYNIISIFSEEIYDDIINRWNEPHRFYHNINHLNYILNELENKLSLTDEEKNTIIIVSFFHDVIYNPKRKDNEERSVEYFIEKCIECNIKSETFIDNISRIIMDTKYRVEPTEKVSKLFWKIDNSVLRFPISKLIEVEHNIFLEYQWVSYVNYKKGRVEFLESCLGTMGNEVDNNLKELIEYVKNRVIRIGIYAGSFNPFHTGHLNILQKSKPLFDKVIVAFGNNPEKEESEKVFPSCLDYIHRLEYNGLITELIDEIEERGSIVTLIRGIRNGVDLSYESNQLSFIKDIRPNTNVIYIPCDKEFEHISSSAIRNLMKFNKDLANKYLV
jgi:pantetheine-phosphate adenylyltransferase